MVAGSANAKPRVILDADFGVAGKTFAEINAAKGVHITGRVPDGWTDNTGWKPNVVAEYRPIKEGGRQFLRIQQTSGDGMQFMRGLPGLEKKNGYYRLTFTARSILGLSLAVRSMGEPYRALSSYTPATNGRWRDFSYDFHLSPYPQEIGLFVYTAGNGSFDLQKLKLIELSEQDLIAETKAKYPQAGSGNLLTATVFPLGLPSGWSIDRDYSDGDQVTVESDPQVFGPSGYAALRIDAANGIRLYSAPLAVRWSFETHVLSASLCGDWSGSLIVADGRGQVCAQTPLKLSGKTWRRIELPFRPILFAPSHVLRLEGQGTLWLDALQLEHAAKATAYTRQKPMEVSLALPPSDAASARVQFTDEPTRIRYATVGKTPGAVLRTWLVIMYGDEKLLPPINVDPASSGVITYEPFASHGLGPYRLEAWVEDRQGRRISPFNEIVFYRFRRPRYWGKDAPGSFFGVHTLSTNRHLTMAKAVGVNWARLHDAGTEYIGWALLEPKKGVWRFRDADLLRYRRHHLKLLGLLSTTPGWASILRRPITGYRERYLEPRNMDDWANAVRTIVSHHRRLIDSYEIWNEPWGSSFWLGKIKPKERRRDAEDRFEPSDTPSKDYARLQKVAYAAAHEAFPGVTIVGFNTFMEATGAKWTKDLLEFGGLDTCDAVSYHHYEQGLTGFPGDPNERAYRSAMGPIIENMGRVPKPVWMSEGAPLSGDVGNGFYHHTLPYQNDNDNWRIADRLARFLITRKANGEAREFLYTMHGHSTFGGPVSWTTLVTADGFLHPSAAAHSALAWLLEDTTYLRRLMLADGVYAYLFIGPDRAVAAITTGPAHAAYALPAAAGVQLLDLFGNSVGPGTTMDDRVHYVQCKEGLTKLQAVLGVK